MKDTNTDQKLSETPDRGGVAAESERQLQGQPTFTPGRHIMLRCPHCDQLYEAKIDNNPLVKDGLMIEPLPVEIAVESELES